jgi:hypothetical protein
MAARRWRDLGPREPSFDLNHRRRHNGPVDFELQVIPDCSNTAGAFDLFRLALRDLGLENASIQVTIVEDDAQAVRLGFAGSPTFLADGQDLFLNGSLTPAWGCRLYPGTSGLTGLPQHRELRAALAAVVG